MPDRSRLKPLIAISVLLLGLSLAPFVIRQSQPPSILEQIQHAGELVVLTRNGPTTFYEGPFGPTGFEYDLVELFAEQLGVRLRIVTPERFDDIIPLVAQRRVHLAAAGLTVTEARKRRVRFGPAYQEITPQLVYRRGNKPPRHTTDLASGLIEVVTDSSHAERLRQLSAFTSLNWRRAGQTWPSSWHGYGRRS